MKPLGAYKGKRHRAPAPVFIIIECPGCGWRGQAAKPEEAEIEYVLHLNNVHHGTLECAFCDIGLSRGLRFLPDFATLAAHVHHFHPEKFAAHETDPMMLPVRAFR
jgi:hypothetical protein